MCVKCNDTSCNGSHCSSLPKGLRGPRGYQGEKGDKGDKGDTGLTGPQGPQGFQGLPGTTGPAGAQGTQGVPGPTGSPGAPGLPGANGVNGSNGLPGAMGATGATGPAGNTGPQGIQGPTGLPGVSAYKFVKEFESTTFNNAQIVVPRVEMQLCSDLPDGCLAGDAVALPVDFHIQLWAMDIDPAPTNIWFLVPAVNIGSILVDSIVGNVVITLIGSSQIYRVRVVILA